MHFIGQQQLPEALSMFLSESVVLGTFGIFKINITFELILNITSK